MAFVEYDYFVSLYGADAVDSASFNRILWNAEKLVKEATTGFDGICKLDVAFPTLDNDIEAVKRCVCEVVNTMNQLERAERNASDGKVIASMSAGNESISYAVGAGLIGSVLSDRKAQTKLLNDTIDSYLRGTKDNNGVNLLYRGAYPYML